MRVPKKPPSLAQILAESGDKWKEAMNKGTEPSVQKFMQEVNNKYLHWDKLRLYPMPQGLTSDVAWILVWLNRRNKQILPLTFRHGPTNIDRTQPGEHKLSFVLPPKHLEWLQKIDRQAGWSGQIFGSMPDDNDRYLTSSLMEEAIASSQLEGASTTRKIAKEMLRSNRAPRDKAEQMIANNYRTILEIRELKNQKLTANMLCQLQEMLTEKTLDAADAAGRFRRPEERVQVIDVRTNEILYNPPSADEIGFRVEEICAFANSDSDPFIHPVIKAIALYFAIGFVHPFVDGNGRTARGRLFYWFMLKEGYAAFEYLPISRILMRAPMKYARAYFYTESDDGDLTYFNHYQLQAILQAISSLHDYFKAQAAVRREAGELIEAHPELNYRQAELVKHLLQHPAGAFSIPAYAGKYRITYPTAKSDLDGLLQAGFVEKFKRGRTAHFRPVPHLAKSIAQARKAKREIS